MKASDLSKVLGADPSDMVGNLLKATQAHQFERDILEHCFGNRMDRVVTALDFGNESVIHEGITDFLFFLVFELAEGDLRRRVSKRAEFDLLWIISALHEYCVGVSQLHRGEVFHNDIKPANALVFAGETQKIADLGRATTPLMSVAHDGGQCVGDRRFAPPEQIYALDSAIRADARFGFYRAGDLYNLGSLAHYLLTGTSVTDEIITRLKPEHRPLSSSGGWSDTVSLVLPYWQSAFADLLQEARAIADESWDEMAIEEFNFVVSLIAELCEPKWRERGDRRFIGKPNQYDLARYITRLDLARTKVIISKSKNAG
ncbi:protein kinase domain-containing protein [Sphingomonas sp. S2-65]|uniref:protein kinase domain-containing protein n=1 Tax=Sphingomonas sp. S2-65 TaxID=2903960 RepID=UPI001F1B84B2|nr:protein kinase [Sphingomonas sp. S2-65]UYY59513.1 protein kinase [Sphingomonas sp. S2-65]